MVLFHTLFDFLLISNLGGGAVAAATSAGVMIWAVLVMILFKPADLSRARKSKRFERVHD